MHPDDIIQYIQCEPLISSVPLDPGVTNYPESITGYNTEDSEENEGYIRYDVIFDIYTPDGIYKYIINLEAQKDSPTSYDIFNRATYYACRMISSQKSREFSGQNYNDLKKVYSIWICMNEKENTLTHYHLSPKENDKSRMWLHNEGLLNIIMIGLSNKLPNSTDNIYDFLGTLFTTTLTKTEKEFRLSNIYNIDINPLRKDVEKMCNLSDGIWENAIEKGMAQGIEQGIEQGKRITKINMIINMNEQGVDINTIVKVSELTLEEVEKIIKSN